MEGAEDPPAGAAKRRSRTLISSASVDAPMSPAQAVSSVASTPTPSLQSAGGHHRISVAERLSGAANSPMVAAGQGGHVEETKRLVEQLAPRLLSIREQQPLEVQELVVPQLEQLAQLLRSCRIQQPAAREVTFQPAWQSKVGHLHEVVDTLRRFSHVYLRNRSSLIVRAFPGGSAHYMELTCRLVYATVGQLVGANHPPPLEIQPILLEYSSSTGCAAQQLPPMGPLLHGGGSMGAFCRQIQWTSTVLLRVRFACAQAAADFGQRFNHSARQVDFPRGGKRPFAHPDQCRPERMLRQRLQAVCAQRNEQGHTRQQRFFHNGTQLFQRSLDSHRAEPVRYEVDVVLNHLHTVVTTLRKYAQLYEQKRSFAIVQHLPMHPFDPQADWLSIKETLERVVAAAGAPVPLGMYRVGRQPVVTMQHGRPLQPALVRVLFESPAAAGRFIGAFRRAMSPRQEEVALSPASSSDSNGWTLVGRRRRQVSPLKRPFAHRDLTPPELALSYALQQHCRQENAASRGAYFYVRDLKLYEKREHL